MLNSKPYSEMPGHVSGISEFLDAFDPLRTPITCSVHAVYTTDPSLLLVSAMLAISGIDILVEYLPTEFWFSAS